MSDVLREFAKMFSAHRPATARAVESTRRSSSSTSSESPIRRFTPAGADPASVIDVRAVFQQGHRDLAVDEIPPVLLPRKGRFGVVDYEKMFCPAPLAADVFDLRGINRETGCIVVVRPDQYVAHVLPLHGHDALTDFIAGVLVDA